MKRPISCTAQTFIRLAYSCSCAQANMTKQSISCDCGNVLECIEESESIKPKYRSISGRVRLKCNDCSKEQSVSKAQDRQFCRCNAFIQRNRVDYRGMSVLPKLVVGGFVKIASILLDTLKFLKPAADDTFLFIIISGAEIV